MYWEEEVMRNGILTVMVVHGWNKKKIVGFMLWQLRCRRKGNNLVAFYINRLVQASMILEWPLKTTEGRVVMVKSLFFFFDYVLV